MLFERPHPTSNVAAPAEPSRRRKRQIRRSRARKARRQKRTQNRQTPPPPTRPSYAETYAFQVPDMRDVRAWLGLAPPREAPPSASRVTPEPLAAAPEHSARPHQEAHSGVLDLSRLPRNQLLAPADVAKALGISQSTLRNTPRTRLPFHVIGNGTQRAHRRYQVVDVLTFLNPEDPPWDHHSSIVEPTEQTSMHRCTTQTRAASTVSPRTPVTNDSLASVWRNLRGK